MKYPATSSGLLCAALLFAAGTGQAQAATVMAGAVSTNAGAKLSFINSTNLDAASGFVEPLIHGAFSNRIPATNRYYFTTDLVFSALSSGDAGGAAIGANLVCEVVSVAGPSGGSFQFWEQGEFWPTYQFPVGGVYAADKSKFDVSDIGLGAGRPDGDAFGSIPGRRFSVSKPGEYTVTFRLLDISANHPTAEAPVHAPSDPLAIKFQTGADLNITQLVVTNRNVAMLTFRQSGFTNLLVEASPDLSGTLWTPVAGPFADSPVGSDVTSSVITNDPALQSVFYRLRTVE